MSGPDRRDTAQVPGQDPIDVEENFPETDLSYRRAYHIRADLKVPMSVAAGSPANYHVQADLDVDFNARQSEAGYYWNDQPIVGDYDPRVTATRTEYTALDVANLIEDEDYLSVPWSPSQLRSLAMHLDAEDLVSSPVTIWPDRTAHGYDIAQVPGFERPPTWGAALLANDQPGVRFRWKTNAVTYDGQVLRSTAAALRAKFADTTLPWTVHLVLQLDSFSADANANDFYSVFDAGDSGATTYVPSLSYGWQGDNSGLDYITAYGRSGGGNTQLGTNAGNFPDSLTSETSLITYRWTGSALTLYINGMQHTVFYVNNYGSGGFPTPTANVTNISFGLDYADGTGDTPMATYGAVYIQTEAVSDYDLAALAAYVAGRWQ